MTTSEPLLPLDLPQTELPKLQMWPTPRNNEAMAYSVETAAKRAQRNGYSHRLEEAIGLASMSSAAGSRAKISPSPARVLEWPDLSPVCGSNMPELLARLDPDTFSWKTSQLCWVEGFQSYSETWPRSGFQVAGTVSLPLPSGHRIVEIESGS